MFGHKGRNLQNDVTYNEMRETVLVGGKLSPVILITSRSDRTDFVEVVQKGLDPEIMTKL